MENTEENKNKELENETFSKKLEIQAAVDKFWNFFKSADQDGGGGLDVEEFTKAMATFYPSDTPEEMLARHMQIDSNCDGTVDFIEYLDFELKKITAKERLNFDQRVFPLPMKTVELGHYKKIIQIIAQPMTDVRNEVNLAGSQEYIGEEYLSVTSDGVLNFWTNRFDEKAKGFVYTKENPTPFSHKPKIHVNDMVYIKERQEVAIATTERELRFYVWGASKLSMRYAVITEGGRVTTMDYWSDGTKAVFSFGDSKGFLYVCVSYDIRQNGLFNEKAFERIKLESYYQVYMAALLKNASREFLVVSLNIFNEPVGLIKYIPSLEEFAVCGQTSTTMVVVSLPKSQKEPSKKVFANRTGKKIFTCVAYCTEKKELVTGGEDGVMRWWAPYKKEICVSQSVQHNNPITHVFDNPEEKIVVCIHEDHTICIWSVLADRCIQIIKAEEMGNNWISAVYYGLQNNELVLANTTIGILLGKGTDLCKNMLLSHSKPLCTAIYHNIFKQIVSVCQKGTVTIWDVKTSKTIMQFNASPFKMIATTAIAFNEALRKLITVCNDGKVRLWNFNNGEELEVLPVTVPSSVTGMICARDRVFISSKNSNVIYNLNLNGQDHIYLEHPFIVQGVSSIDIDSKAGILISAGGNGIVLVWDLDTNEAIQYINLIAPVLQNCTKPGRTGPMPIERQTHFVTEYDRIPVPEKLLRTKTDILDQNEVLRSPLVLCLKTADSKATLLIVEECYISGWIYSQGRSMEKFKATDTEDAIITAISADPSEKFLTVGDSIGNVCIWDISLNPPVLMSSWKAHNGPVMSIECNPSFENIFTSGYDCNVHVWTNKQRKVGTFGKDEWDVKELNPNWEPPQEPDVLELEPQYWPNDEEQKVYKIEKEEAEPSMSDITLRYIQRIERALEKFEMEKKLYWSEYLVEDVSEVSQEELEVKIHKPIHIKRHKTRHFLEKRKTSDLQTLYNHTSSDNATQQLPELCHNLENMHIKFETKYTPYHNITKHKVTFSPTPPTEIPPPEICVRPNETDQNLTVPPQSDLSSIETVIAKQQEANNDGIESEQSTQISSLPSDVARVIFSPRPPTEKPPSKRYMRPHKRHTKLTVRSQSNSIETAKQQEANNDGIESEQSSQKSSLLSDIANVMFSPRPPTEKPPSNRYVRPHKRHTKLTVPSQSDLNSIETVTAKQQAANDDYIESKQSSQKSSLPSVVAKVDSWCIPRPQSKNVKPGYRAIQEIEEFEYFVQPTRHKNIRVLSQSDFNNTDTDTFAERYTHRYPLLAPITKQNDDTTSRQSSSQNSPAPEQHHLQGLTQMSTYERDAFFSPVKVTERPKPLPPIHSSQKSVSTKPSAAIAPAQMKSPTILPPISKTGQKVRKSSLPSSVAVANVANRFNPRPGQFTSTQKNMQPNGARQRPKPLPPINTEQAKSQKVKSVKDSTPIQSECKIILPPISIKGQNIYKTQ